MSDEPKYRMRFKPTQNSPAFIPGEVRELPMSYARDEWWTLIDSVPDLVIPPPREEESVFIEEVFVPPEDLDLGEAELGTEVKVFDTPGIKFVDTDHIALEDVEKGDLIAVKDDPEEPVESEDLKAFYKKKTVKELRNIIKELGGTVNYIHRKYQLIEEILRLEAEKEA